MVPHASPEQIRYTKVKTPLGDFYLAAGREGLVLGSFGESFSASRRELEGTGRYRFVASSPSGNSLPEKHLRSATAALRDYFAGGKVDFKRIPVASLGTPFQKRAWQILRSIPYGKTLSYGELASRLKIAGGARAVGGACGSNPVAIIVPCHRVLRSDRSIGGFSGGISKKKKLLAIEKVAYRG